MHSIQWGDQGSDLFAASRSQLEHGFYLSPKALRLLLRYSVLHIHRPNASKIETDQDLCSLEVHYLWSRS